ncbi:MAG: DUF3299 domain-containing protein [Alphaproteobacteria bacterium]
MRFMLALMLAALAIPAIAATDPPITLQWDQLVPVEQRAKALAGDTIQNMPPAFRREDDDPSARRKEILNSLTAAYNGKRVRIPGFIVPLAMDGTEVKEFLLVPWFGACIHVPPPPPNQIVYVASNEAVSVEDIYDPVWVTGVLTTAVLSTELADTGYTLQGESIEPYGEDKKQ